MDLRDVRMVERREDLRFALEPGQAIRIGGESFRQDLQGDIAVELRVVRPLHFAHAAFANLGGDLVVAESGADCERHLIGGHEALEFLEH